MSCDLDSGRAVLCKDQVGGIKSVFIGNYVDMLAGTEWDAETSDTVTAIATQTFYRFDVRPETSSLTITYNSDPANGTTFFEQALSLTFQRLDATDIADIRTLCAGRPNIWVEDNNLNVWLIGAEFGCNVSGGNLVTGTAFGDLTGYTIDFTGREQNPVWIASLPTVANPLAGVSGASIV